MAWLLEEVHSFLEKSMTGAAAKSGRGEWTFAGKNDNANTTREKPAGAGGRGGGKGSGKGGGKGGGRGGGKNYYRNDYRSDYRAAYHPHDDYYYNSYHKPSERGRDDRNRDDRDERERRGRDRDDRRDRDKDDRRERGKRDEVSLRPHKKRRGE